MFKSKLHTLGRNATSTTCAFLRVSRERHVMTVWPSCRTELLDLDVDIDSRVFQWPPTNTTPVDNFVHEHFHIAGNIFPDSIFTSMIGELKGTV